MNQEDRDKFFAELDRRGEASVRADLEAAHFGARTALATEWLRSKELEWARRAEQRDDRMVEATQKAADAADRSAGSARRSEKWAVIAGIAAAVAALAAVATFAWPFIHR